MFKEKVIKGLICLLAIMLAGKGWATDIDETIRALKNKETRREAVVTLEKMGASAVPSLIKEAEDRGQKEETRIAAIRVLGKIKDRRGRESLERILAKDKSNFLRSASAIGLGHLGNKKAIPKLKGALNDPSGDVQMRAVWALAKLGDYSGYDLALETIKGKDVTAQLLAIDALEAIGNKGAIPILEGYIKDPNSTTWTRIFSGLAIKKLEIQGLNSKNRLAFLKNALSDKNYEVVRWSSEELKEIVREGQPQRNEVVNILKECLKERKEHPGPQSYAALKILLSLIEERKIDPSELKDLVEEE